MKDNKHYDEIVEIIRKFIVFDEGYLISGNISQQFKNAVNSIADDLSRRNANFKRDKFIEAVFK